LQPPATTAILIDRMRFTLGGGGGSNCRNFPLLLTEHHSAISKFILLQFLKSATPPTPT